MRSTVFPITAINAIASTKCRFSQLAPIPMVPWSEIWTNIQYGSSGAEIHTYCYVLCPPRSKILPTVAGGNPGQVAPLTSNEIADRRKTFSRFWTEPELPTIHFRSTAWAGTASKPLPVLAVLRCLTRSASDSRLATGANEVQDLQQQRPGGKAIRHRGKLRRT